jgi:hypothetical protein
VGEREQKPQAVALAAVSATASWSSPSGSRAS